MHTSCLSKLFLSVPATQPLSVTPFADRDVLARTLHVCLTVQPFPAADHALGPADADLGVSRCAGAWLLCCAILHCTCHSKLGWSSMTVSPFHHCQDEWSQQRLLDALVVRKAAHVYTWVSM